MKSRLLASAYLCACLFTPIQFSQKRFMAPSPPFSRSFCFCSNDRRLRKTSFCLQLKILMPNRNFRGGIFWSPAGRMETSTPLPFINVPLYQCRLSPLTDTRARAPWLGKSCWFSLKLNKLTRSGQWWFICWQLTKRSLAFPCFQPKALHRFFPMQI